MASGEQALPEDQEQADIVAVPDADPTSRAGDVSSQPELGHDGVETAGRASIDQLRFIGVGPGHAFVVDATIGSFASGAELTGSCAEQEVSILAVDHGGERSEVSRVKATDVLIANFHSRGASHGYVVTECADRISLRAGSFKSGELSLSQVAVDLEAVPDHIGWLGASELQVDRLIVNLETGETRDYPWQLETLDTTESLRFFKDRDQIAVTSLLDLALTNSQLEASLAYLEGGVGARSLRGFQASETGLIGWIETTARSPETSGILLALVDPLTGELQRFDPRLDHETGVAIEGDRGPLRIVPWMWGVFGGEFSWTDGPEGLYIDDEHANGDPMKATVTGWDFPRDPDASPIHILSHSYRTLDSEMEKSIDP